MAIYYYDYVMSSSIEFINFVCDQIAPAGSIRHRKMFGEYMIYCDDRPVLLVCDDTVYIKQIPETTAEFSAHNTTAEYGIPYQGARQHYILDIENTALAIDMVRMLARITPLPKSKTRKIIK